MEDNTELTPMISILNQLKDEGYTEEYRMTDQGRLCTADGSTVFAPEQVTIVNFYRFEGVSNPDDMAILYVLETDTGHKGTISDAYGTYANSEVENFMKKVTDQGKNLDKAS